MAITTGRPHFLLRLLFFFKKNISCSNQLSMSFHAQNKVKMATVIVISTVISIIKQNLSRGI